MTPDEILNALTPDERAAWGQRQPNLSQVPAGLVRRGLVRREGGDWVTVNGTRRRLPLRVTVVAPPASGHDPKRLGSWATDTPVVLLVATAQPPTGSPALGAGSLPCSSWSDARQTGKALEHGAWVLGFLSGFGSAWRGRPETVDPLNDMTADGVLTWMDSYCEAQPSDPIAKAALAFIRAHPN